MFLSPSKKQLIVGLKTFILKIFLLLKCFLFLRVFSENTTNCINRICKNTCTNKCHNDHIDLFSRCDWHNISIADSDHRNRRPINRINKLYFPVCIIYISLVQPSVRSSFRLYISNIMKSTSSEMSEQEDYQKQRCQIPC